MNYETLKTSKYRFGLHDIRNSVELDRESSMSMGTSFTIFGLLMTLAFTL